MVWLYYTCRHGVAALDFSTVSGCDELVIGQTYARGGTFDLLMTAVPDLVWVAVVAPLGSSDHSSLSIAIAMALAIPNLCVSRRVLLKHRVNWNAVCETIGVMPWRSIWSGDNNFERLTVHLSLLVELLVSTKVILVRKNKPWLMMTAGIHSTSCRRLIYSGLVSTLEVTVRRLFSTRGDSLLFMSRLCVRLVSEAGMF